jgi:hypothetical protein
MINETSTTLDYYIDISPEINDKLTEFLILMCKIYL